MSLTPPQVRFVEMVIDRLTARASWINSLHAGVPEALVAGKVKVIDGIPKQLAAVHFEFAEAG